MKKYSRLLFLIASLQSVSLSAISEVRFHEEPREGEGSLEEIKKQEERELQKEEERREEEAKNNIERQKQIERSYQQEQESFDGSIEMLEKERNTFEQNPVDPVEQQERHAFEDSLAQIEAQNTKQHANERTKATQQGIESLGAMHNEQLQELQQLAVETGLEQNPDATSMTEEAIGAEIENEGVKNKSVIESIKTSFISHLFEKYVLRKVLTNREIEQAKGKPVQEFERTIGTDWSAYKAKRNVTSLEMKNSIIKAAEFGYPASVKQAAQAYVSKVLGGGKEVTLPNIRSVFDVVVDQGLYNKALAEAQKMPSGLQPQEQSAYNYLLKNRFPESVLKLSLEKGIDINQFGRTGAFNPDAKSAQEIQRMNQSGNNPLRSGEMKIYKEQLKNSYDQVLKELGKQDKDLTYTDWKNIVDKANFASQEEDAKYARW